jgi:hypothetical protein
MDSSIFQRHLVWRYSSNNVKVRKCKFIFNRFIGHKLALVQFWIWFDTALKCQQHEELIDDNTSMHMNPKLFTSWDIESHGGSVFTPKVFIKFQEEVLAAREHCDVQHTTEMDDRKIVYVADNSQNVRDVSCFNADQIYKCSCMLFESIRIPCHHIIRVFRGARISELPLHYITQRWTKNCKR